MAGMSLSKMKTFNSGYTRGKTAPNGPHYIMVPKSNVAKLRNSLATGDIAAVQPTSLANNSVSSGSYKVRNGDTLSGIAKRLGVPVKDLQRANNLRGASIKPGQTLSVSSSNRLADNGDSITYQVRKGDSLASIAKRHGVNIKDVVRWNSVASNSAKNIQPGDKLTLFVDNSATPDS